MKKFDLVTGNYKKNFKKYNSISKEGIEMELPKEILILIFRFLDVRDMISISMVSKDWLENFFYLNSLWNHFCQRDFPLLFTKNNFTNSSLWLDYYKQCSKFKVLIVCLEIGKNSIKKLEDVKQTIVESKFVFRRQIDSLKNLRHWNRQEIYKYNCVLYYGYSIDLENLKIGDILCDYVDRGIWKILY